ncbi:bifunctional riboflavin kinase/FAD synthetase, partial [Streptomyces griseolus]|nr:bifunctional riboflavin kinase/FAD synthetase [Streptomyces griseolus]
MQCWRGLEDIPDDWGRSVVTIGSYDGVHRAADDQLMTAVDPVV